MMGQFAGLTRREGLGCAWGVTVVVLLAAFALMGWFLVTPPAVWVDLGATDQLPREEPVPRAFTLSDGMNVSVWVVYSRGQWVVFDGTTPLGTHCRYQWEPVTGRFEDPCSGAKFSITGEFLDAYAAFAGQTVRNLDRYATKVEDGELMMNAHQLIPAESFIARALTPEPGQ